MLDTKLCATLFVALTGISVGGVALISLYFKRTEKTNTEITGSKLSKLNPAEYQSIGYVFIAFACSLAGLLVTLFFSVVIGITIDITGSIPTWVNYLGVILVFIILVITLAFLYMGIGHLFNVTIRPHEPRGTLLSEVPGIKYLNWLMVKIGDLLTRGLFRTEEKQP
jgi:hypothetical protein